MAEYIEKDAAKNAIYAAMRKHDEYDSCERKIIGGLAEADDAIDTIPAADVVPVRHGRWVEWWPGDCAQIMTGEEMLFMCNECTAKFSEMYRYCPHCGALMDKEVDNG